jgi:predicted amidophosphoribosyltransferase
MDCPVCTANAEQIAAAIDGMGIICPTCGEYEVSSAVLAAEDWQRLDPDERCDVLDNAKRSGQPDVRPMITNDLLAAYMEAREEPAAQRTI